MWARRCICEFLFFFFLEGKEGGNGREVANKWIGLLICRWRGAVGVQGRRRVSYLFFFFFLACADRVGVADCRLDTTYSVKNLEVTTL